MAIYNLSGNFQPPSVDSGRSLPQPSNTAPSKSSENTKEGISEVSTTKLTQVQVETEQVAKNNTPVEKADVAASQIEEFQQFNQSIDRSLQFKVDDELGVTIVRVIDRETDELIRQFPPEELINLSKRLKELNDDKLSNSGVLLQEKV
ncbi:flagellar protein FlaG [Aliikangiella sp. IMCC44359]|uniref:flagellar protein FlaG n=1 Tax=Aliikangiella sp. IMCC44359 TaxID=3459125 RepID=UPI00403AD8FF